MKKGLHSCRCKSVEAYVENTPNIRETHGKNCKKWRVETKRKNSKITGDTKNQKARKPRTRVHAPESRTSIGDRAEDTGGTKHADRISV